MYAICTYKAVHIWPSCILSKVRCVSHGIFIEETGHRVRKDFDLHAMHIKR